MVCFPSTYCSCSDNNVANATSNSRRAVAMSGQRKKVIVIGKSAKQSRYYIAHGPDELTDNL
jgi:hypothetical protein